MADVGAVLSSTSAPTYEGPAYFRQRVAMSTLSGKPVRFCHVREMEDEPGLRDFEVSFLRLVDKVSNGTVIEIDHTGTTVSYRPGVLVGGKVHHECPPSRAIGYFLEAMVWLAPFCKKPLVLTLVGITNDAVDPCVRTVDTVRTASLPLLKRFGLVDGIELKIFRRGCPPLGGGEIRFTCPVIRALTPVVMLERGKVKRVRGLAYSANVSPQMVNRIVDAARGRLNQFIPDVYIYTDHYKGADAGKSPGFGITLVAESTNGVLYSAECAAAPGEAPEDIGVRATKLLLEEIARGGCVDTTNQAPCLLFMVLCSEDVSKVRLGKLSPFTVQFLRDLRTFFGVTFKLTIDPADKSTVATCLGLGFSNTNKKIT